MYECVTPECDRDACVYGFVFVCSCCLLIFLPFPGHTHTQLLSVSMLLTILKIAVQSMLDLLLHQSHTSSHVIFSLCVSHYSICVTDSVLQGRNPCCRRTESAMKEKMKSLADLPSCSALLIDLTKSPLMWRDHRRICMKLTEGGKKKEQGSIHYQVMESDERRSVK